MSLDLAHFTPWRSLVGGALIGASAALLMIANGRVAGVSGIVGGAVEPRSDDRAWRLAFLLGLAVAAIAAPLAPSVPRVVVGAPALVVAGLFVGVGTRLANGCTSGHGVCGLARGRARSVVATLTFIATGVATVFAARHLSP